MHIKWDSINESELLHWYHCYKLTPAVKDGQRTLFVHTLPYIISAQRLLRETWSGQLPDLYDYPARHRDFTLGASVVLTVKSRVKT